MDKLYISVKSGDPKNLEPSWGFFKCKCGEHFYANREAMDLTQTGMNEYSHTAKCPRCSGEAVTRSLIKYVDLPEEVKEKLPATKLPRHKMEWDIFYCRTGKHERGFSIQNEALIEAMTHCPICGEKLNLEEATNAC